MKKYDFARWQLLKPKPHWRELQKKIFINPDLKATERHCYKKQLKIYRESLKMMLEDNKARAEHELEQQTQRESDTPTPISKTKPPEKPEQSAPDEPLFKKPKIKPTGKIK